MKKDWLKDIHDRMTDFEADEPQSLWEDICKAENKATEPLVIGNQTPPNKWWIKSSVAAIAACLLLVWYLHPLPTDNATKPAQATQQLSANFPKQDSYDSLMEAEQRLKTIPLHHSRPLASHKRQEGTEQPGEVQNIAKATTSKTDSATDITTSKNLPSLKGEQTQSQPHSEYYFAQVHKGRNKKSKLSVGISTSGGINANSHQLFQGGYQAASSVLSESEWIDSPLLGIMALNRGANTEKKASHHAPIRTGLTFSYQLNDRWSIESGITYALVNSDFQEGSNANFIHEKQQLHYVGIPIGITHKLFTWQRLDLYLSANVLAEYCVYGQSSKSFSIGDKRQGNETISTIQSHPMQWSIGAKAGVQYNFNSIVSIYTEPGSIYYFDDQSSLETVFKQKAFDFNLNLGLRFKVGNHR